MVPVSKDTYTFIQGQGRRKDRPCWQAERVNRRNLALREQGRKRARHLGPASQAAPSQADREDTER